MAKFILDGQVYGGGNKVVKLTQAEYDALPDSKNSDDVIYTITDAGELSAVNMSYDGSETGLGNNVQDAIDELNSNLIAGELQFQFATDGEGNYGYLGADGSLVPFKKVPKLEIDKLWYHRYGQTTNITGLSGYTKFSWSSLSLSNAKNPIARFYDKNGTQVTSITMSASGGNVDISSIEKIYIYAQDNNSTSQSASINGVVIE